MEDQRLMDKYGKSVNFDQNRIFNFTSFTTISKLRTHLIFINFVCIPNFQPQKLSTLLFFIDN